MMWNFTPTEDEPGPDRTPFLEDARADYAPYYASEKSEEAARDEVTIELTKLGAIKMKLQPGFFTINKLKRYGYNIHFILRGNPAVIRVAGLPMRKETPAKTKQVRVQALLNVRDWLKAAVTSQIFIPGANPLTPFMLVDGQRTVAEVMEVYIQTGQLPLLTAGQSQPDIEIEVE